MASNNSKKDDSTQIGQKPDPTHKEVVSQCISQTFARFGVFGKACMMAYMFIVTILVAMPDMLMFKLGLRSNKRAFKLKRVLTEPEVYLGEYVMPVAASNCVVIKGKNGKVFIRSPPQALPYIVDQVKEIGEVGAIFVTLSHDTYADKWKTQFPSAVVIGPKPDIPYLNNRCKVDLATEDAAKVLSEYYITRVLLTSKFTAKEEDILLIQLPNNKIAACLGCGFGNIEASITQPFTWRYLIALGSGFKMLRTFSLIFTKSHVEARKFWYDELAKIPNLYALLPLHGPAIVGDHIAQMLAKSGPAPEFSFVKF